MIDFTGICKSYGKQDIFDNVSFRINPGERVGIVGPNGMGKTTLFQILTGEISPDHFPNAAIKKTRPKPYFAIRQKLSGEIQKTGRMRDVANIFGLPAASKQNVFHFSTSIRVNFATFRL